MMKCNYCNKPADVWYTKTERVRSRGHWKALTVSVTACGEHENCVNFQANVALDKNPALTRKDHSQ